MSNRIPLFPLNVVLLPGKLLPLHIFEPRYKQMIGAVVNQREPFGVVRVHENGIARVGCTAIVVRVIKTYEDGRMDILTVGQAPFRITEVHQEKPYLEATIEFLTDESAAGATPEIEMLREIFEQCYGLAHGSAPETEAEGNSEAGSDDPGASLAYEFASDLPLDLDAAQQLLEMRNESDRQRRLLEEPRKLLPRLRRIAEMRSRTAGNGHGAN